MDFYSFPGTVGADDESQGLQEGDDVLVFRVEAPDTLYQHFVNGTHLCLAAFFNQKQWRLCVHVLIIAGKQFEEDTASSLEKGRERGRGEGERERVGFKRG